MPRTENLATAFMLDPERNLNLPVFWVMFSSPFKSVDFFIQQWVWSKEGVHMLLSVEARLNCVIILGILGTWGGLWTDPCSHVSWTPHFAGVV